MKALKLYFCLSIITMSTCNCARQTKDINSDKGSVAEILKDKKGDFDPWNSDRWSEWYEDGLISKPFIIDTSIKFAFRDEVWIPDLSKLLENTPGDERFSLFQIVGDNHGIEIDGNGLVIDARHKDFYDQTIDEAYDEGYSVMKKAVIDRKRRRCFYFNLVNDQDESNAYHIRSIPLTR